MTSKFELSISTEYVPDWGLVEAFRELFQNALDNETVNPENKMGWSYDDKNLQVVISNKTSTLDTKSLLLGSGTKHDRTDTIGKHGEGYKIAFMVLLRNGKGIRVENYGANEIWGVRLVKSRKYNGCMVPTVFVNKEPIWKKKPNNDLTIIVDNITPEEYETLVNKNLHLRKEVSRLDNADYGGVLTDKSEQGNIYVNGLYVTHLDGFKYGYDFTPSIMSLDRDRKLVDSFNVEYYASKIWNKLSVSNEQAREIATKLIYDEARDIKYVNLVMDFSHDLSDSVTQKFIDDNGENAVPVTSNSEYDTVINNGFGNPIIVSERMKSVLSRSTILKTREIAENITVKEQLEQFKENIRGKLTEDEIEQFEELIKKVNN